MTYSPVIQFAEDAAHTDGDKGIQLLTIRDDTLNVRSGTEGDYEPLHTNANGALWTIDVNSANVSTKIDTIAAAVSGSEMQVDIVSAPTLTVQATNLDIRDLTNADVVTAELSAVDNAVLDAIAASLNALDNTVSGNELQVDVLTMPTVAVTGTFWQATQPVSGTVSVTGVATLAEQQTQTTHLATIAGDTTDIEAAIEGVTYVDDAGWTDNTSKHLLVGGVYQSTPHTVTDGDVTPFLTDVNGRLATIVSGNVAVTNAGLTALNGAISGSEVQVDVLTMPTVTIQDGGNTITVDGTVAVTNGGLTELAAAINASSQMDVNIAANGIGLATSAKQDTIIGHLDGVEGTLTTIDGRVDGIEGLLTTIDADTSILSGLVLATQADDVANTSDGLQVTNFNMVYDGSTWDRLRGTAVDGMLVNLGANNDVTISGTVAVTQSGTWDEIGINDSGNSITVDYATTGSGTATGALRVELPTNGTGVIATVGAVTAITNALPAGTNAIGKLAANSGVDIGDVDVTSISAGSNLIGDVGIQPRTTNGFDTAHASAADGSTALTNSAQAMKASAGKLYGYFIQNPNASDIAYVQFYNTASGSVTVGTTNPLYMLAIPAGSGANLMSDIGITFGTAMSRAATSTAGGNGALTTALNAVARYK